MKSQWNSVLKMMQIRTLVTSEVTEWAYLQELLEGQTTKRPKTDSRPLRGGSVRFTIFIPWADQ